MKIQLTITLNLDDDIWGNSDEEIDWLKKDILQSPETLCLHSNEIGDTIGDITKVTNIKILQK